MFAISLEENPKKSYKSFTFLILIFSGIIGKNKDVFLLKLFPMILVEFAI
jgi:uncharacterized membrane protein YjdF